MEVNKIKSPTINIIYPTFLSTYHHLIINYITDKLYIHEIYEIYELNEEI